MMEETDYIDIPASEKDETYSDDSLYSINSWGADFSFRELISLYEDGDLVKPELQRNYVWDKTEASRFIDSLLLGLPVPSIFLAKTGDDLMLIVDGYQRIMTVYDFVRGIFSKDNKVFRLTNSEKINSRWRGKSFAELDDSYQRKIKITTIHCIIFSQISPKNDDTSMYQIFERINTSGRTLLPQEIRNCVYQGRFNDLLFELNKNENWRKLFGKDEPDARMRDMEFILRFLALSSREFHELDIKQLSLKKFLNEYMGFKNSNTPDILEKNKRKFIRAIDFISSNFDEHIFHNISISDPNRYVIKFNATIYDSIMLATNYLLERELEKSINLSNVEEKTRNLLLDDEYQDLIKVRTTRIDRIYERIQKASHYLYGIDYE
jgi:uncharacterized protein with ParB-like and HNH nuclease domain